MNFTELLQAPQYSLTQAEKEAVLLGQLNELTVHHRLNCTPYRQLLDVLHPAAAEAAALDEVPFLPVGLFKSHRLQSVPQAFKTLTSSGTTGQRVSEIVLDQETARRQTVALSRILTHVLGPNRLPMIIIESSALLRDRLRFSARVAGVLGMMNFGRNHFYALDENMQLDHAGLARFLEQYGSSPFLIFGFTFMAWQYLLEPLRGQGIDLGNGILIHSGGWKKLEAEKVSNAVFRQHWREQTGLARIYNFYGMVEQVGSVYLEGDDGHLYPPNFADIIIRDPYTWQALPPGQPGVIQVLSILPLSYPGHSILTEDLGVVHSIDAGAGGRMGKAFSVLGRVPKAELRGCSDVHASEVSS